MTVPPPQYPIGPSAKVRNKENTSFFKASAPVLCNDMTPKLFKTIFERFVLEEVTNICQKKNLQYKPYKNFEKIGRKKIIFW